jgi:ABC-type transport system involved in multi-copper enzyme maturation permease subunit
MSLLMLVARQELALAVRSRWLQLFAALFALLSLLMSLSGYVLSVDMECRTSPARQPRSFNWFCCWFRSRR